MTAARCPWIFTPDGLLPLVGGVIFIGCVVGAVLGAVLGRAR